VIDLDPDVQYTARVIDHEGFEIYAGPWPVWPPQLVTHPVHVDLTAHPRGCSIHRWVGLVNAGRFRAN
jgi:hypothetical protein